MYVIKPYFRVRKTLFQSWPGEYQELRISEIGAITELHFGGWICCVWTEFQSWRYVIHCSWFTGFKSFIPLFDLMWILLHAHKMVKSSSRAIMSGMFMMIKWYGDAVVLFTGVHRAVL